MPAQPQHVADRETEHGGILWEQPWCRWPAGFPVGATTIVLFRFGLRFRLGLGIEVGVEVGLSHFRVNAARWNFGF